MADVPLTAVVDPATNLFCEDGMSAGRVVVSVPVNPDARAQRYSGNPASPFRVATAQEMTDYDAARVAAAASAQFDGNQLFRAKAISDLAKTLNVQPSALTAAQIAAERARIIAIYKVLT